MATQNTTSRRGLLAASAAAPLIAGAANSAARLTESATASGSDELVTMAATLKLTLDRGKLLCKASTQAEERAFRIARDLGVAVDDGPAEERSAREEVDARRDAALQAAVDIAQEMARMVPRSLAGIDAMLAMLADDELVDFPDEYSDQHEDGRTLGEVAIASMRAGVARMLGTG